MLDFLEGDGEDGKPLVSTKLDTKLEGFRIFTCFLSFYLSKFFFSDDKRIPEFSRDESLLGITFDMCDNLVID